MRSVIQLSAVLPAPAPELYATYLDPVAHAAITGHAVTIAERPGAQFAAFDGMLSGSILATVAPRLIVQSWRSMKFHDADPDSTLILTFAPAGAHDGRIDLLHLDVPQHDYDDVVKGWQTFYFTPWRAHLERRNA